MQNIFSLNLSQFKSKGLKKSVLNEVLKWFPIFWSSVKMYLHQKNVASKQTAINPPMARGGTTPPPQKKNQVFQIFLANVRSFFANKIFSCSLILGTSFHEKIFQVGPTVLVLKIDQREGTGGWQPPPPPPPPIDFVLIHFLKP